MTFNDLISFLLELFALAVYGWSPFAYLGSMQQFSKMLIGIGLVLVVAVLWGKFAAPRAAHRLKGWHLASMKAIVFYPAAILLGLKTNTVLLVTLLLIVSVNLLIEFNAKPRATT